MNILCAQLDLVWENKDANYLKVQKLLEGRTVDPGSLLVLPELFSTGFTMNSRALQEDLEGPTILFFKKLAQQRQIFVLGGYISTSGSSAKPFNEAVMISPSGEVLTRYHKQRLFGLADEPQHYTAGKESLTTSIGPWVVAPTICYDLRFPELFRRSVGQGANLLIVIASWPTVRRNHWMTLLTARAIENQAYVVGVNRCGSDPSLNYSGDSMVIDPQGEIVAQAGAGEQLLVANIEIERVQEWRTRFPAIRDAFKENPIPPTKR